MGTEARGAVLDRAVHGDPDDLQALACILSHRCSAPDAPYGMALGLEPPELASVVQQWFPQIAERWIPACCVAGMLGHHRCPDRASDTDSGYGRFSRNLLQQEEADLCQLFLDHRGDDGIWPVLFARLIARACMEPEHLWMCLGLESRQQLTGILERRFPALVAKNLHNMRWKKFFYKLLCDVEKVWTCTASSCEICPHHAECYAPEE